MPSEDTRPLLSFDLDGVLAAPPLGRNFTIERRVELAPAEAGAGGWAGRPLEPDPRPSLYDRFMIQTYFRVRYRGREAIPGAREAIAAAAGRYRVIVLTARNWRGRKATEAWLRKNGMLEQVERVVMNNSALSSARFKERAAQQLGVTRHVEDDAATAALLARAGVAVDLIDWPGNRGLPFPEGVSRRGDLAALVRALASD